MFKFLFLSLLVFANMDYDPTSLFSGESCTGSMPKEECSSIIHGEWEDKIPSTKKTILNKFGKDPHTLYTTIKYKGLLINLAKVISSVIVSVEITSDRYKLSNGININDKRSQVEKLLGVGIKISDSITKYCAGESDYCLKYEYKNDVVKKIIWLPYFG